MSVVAVKVYQDGFTMAADSIVVRYPTQLVGAGWKQAKLFESGPLVIGGVGTLEEIGLMHLFALTHQPAAETERAMMEFFGEFCDWRKKKTDRFSLENEYLIGFGRSAFATVGMFVSQIPHFNAIGAGADYALTALHLGHGPRAACEAACELSCFCAPPVINIERRDA